MCSPFLETQGTGLHGLWKVSPYFYETNRHNTTRL
uniref:Uncharacterized protein n=1 Tax=Picea sitchensis TaxID=3332 RepID=D5A8H4_PICSI|nr:unknown [Picea sitchensis]